MHSVGKRKRDEEVFKDRRNIKIILTGQPLMNLVATYRRRVMLRQ
jgi:hypothetical protein